MGRTNRFDEDFNRKVKKTKHAKNHRGSGMRVINKWSEETTEDLYTEDSHIVNTTFNTTFNKETKNGY